MTKDLHSAEIITGLNPDHHALKVWKNSGESTFDTTSGGEEKQERSMPLLLTSECFESEEEEQGCASKEEGGKEGSSNSTSICDGAVNASYLIQHCNAVYVVDSPDNTYSVKLKNVSGVSQDLLQPEGMPQKQSVSCATTTAQKGAVLVPFDSCTSSQLNTWECEGARPRDRTQKGDSSLDSSSLFYSLVDLVPQQVGEPVVLGVDNAFLARHSVDKPLHESLYYNYAEEMLAEDMDSMMNMIDSNKAKPYLGDCQAAAMSDPYYQPYSSAFPLPSEAYIGEDGFPLDYTFNGNSVLPPGPSSSYVGSSMSQNGHLTSLQRSDFLQSGFTSSGLTSDFLGTTEPQMTHSVIGTQSNIGFTGSTSILPPEPLQMQTLSITNVGLLASSAGSTSFYGNQANASTGLPTSSSVARTNGSSRRLLSGLESGRNTHLSPVSSIRDGVNTSGHRNSSSILNTIGDHLASGTYREGNSAGNSSNSYITSGANTGGHHAQSGGSVPNGKCDNEEAKASHATQLKCSYCHHEQEVMKGF